MSAPPTRGVALMLMASVLFAVMATFVGVAHALDPTLSTFVASTGRAAVNLLALVVLARGDTALLWGDRRTALWVRGVAGAVSLLAYFGALSHLGIGEAAFLNQTSAVWVVLLSPWLLGERNTPLVWLAVLGSLVGVALLGAPRPEAGDLLGRGLGLVSGLGAAGAYLSVRKASQSNGPITIVFYFTLLGTVASVVAAALTHAPWPTDLRVWACLAGSGLAATGAQLLMTRAYSVSRAGPVAAAGASGPLYTTLLGAIFLGQEPDRHAALGMGILIVTGIGLPILTERMHLNK